MGSSWSYLDKEDHKEGWGDWKKDRPLEWSSWMGMRGKFLQDQPERALPSEAAVSKTSAMMGASANFTKSRVGKLGCLPSAEVLTPDYSQIWQVRSVFLCSPPSPAPTWKGAGWEEVKWESSQGWLPRQAVKPEANMSWRKGEIVDKLRFRVLILKSPKKRDYLFMTRKWLGQLWDWWDIFIIFPTGKNIGSWADLKTKSPRTGRG